MTGATLTSLPPIENVTLHLTQIHVSYENAVRILRIRDSYDWHQRIWQAFASSGKEARDFLVRVDRKEEAFRALVLSRTAPTRPDWCPSDCFGTKPIPDSFFKYASFAFSLLANPTKKVRSNAAGERTKNGRRIPITSREDLLAWLHRKSATSGFDFDPTTTQTVPRGREFFYQNKTNAHGTHTAVEFRGHLRVTDPIAFRVAVASGIGSAKAFGFGLLVLAPLNQT